jgi:hypothetical protein
MHAAIWAYPWDLIDEGVETVTDRLYAMGVDEISLATNYHSVQAFLPHNPERRTFFSRASSYFQPDANYGRLRPVSNETMGEDDWVDQIIAGVDKSPLSLNSWTVGCHNSRLGMRHPETTLTNAFGDSLVFGLCPSNPEVREYLLALVGDLARRGGFQRIELETFDFFHGTGYGWHHEKFHTKLGSLGEFLFGLCFCNQCCDNAAAANIDAEHARSSTMSTIDGIVAGTIPPETDVGTWLRSHPIVNDYVDRRTETLASLFDDLATVTGAVDLGCYIGMLDMDRTWMHGVDLHALAEHLDYYLVTAYEPTRDEAVACFSKATELTPDIPVHAGIHAGYPFVTDEMTLKAMTAGLVDAGAQRVSFYNYGLLPESNLNWIEESIRSVSPSERSG